MTTDQLQGRGLNAATHLMPGDPNSGKKSQLTSSMGNKAERNRERARRKKIRRFFSKTAKDIHEDAKKSGQLIKDYYNALFNSMADYKLKYKVGPWVKASYWQWIEIQSDRVKPSGEKKTINGVEYYKTKSTKKAYTFIIPASIAHTWTSSEEDIAKLQKFKDEHPSISSITDLLNHIVGGTVGSPSIIMEFVGSEPHEIRKVDIPPPTKALNRNGVRHMISMYCRAPVYPDFKPTFREQYVQPQFVEEGQCMWNCVFNEFKDAWDKKHPGSKSKFTYEFVKNIIGKEPGEACWDDFIPLFEKLKCNIKMLNIWGQVEAQYEVKKNNSEAGSKALTIIRHDGHTYRVEDSDLKQSVASKIKSKQFRNEPDEDEKENRSEPSSRMTNIEPSKLNGCVRSLDELRRKALSCDDMKQAYLWMGKESLDDVFEHLWFKEGVQAAVSAYGGHFKRLTIPFGKKNLTLRVPTEDACEKPEFEKDQEALRYEEVMNQAQKKFFDKRFKSHYSNDLIEVFRKSLGSPLKGMFQETDQELVGIDQSKCYPYHLSKIKNIGIFCELDRLLHYDGHRIEECTLYQFSNGEARFGVGVSAKLGRPVSFIRPYKIRPNTLGGDGDQDESGQFTSKGIKGIMEDDVLSEPNKKALCVILIGLLGKAYNRKSRFEVFEHVEEARRFMTTVYDDDELDPSKEPRPICDGKLWLAEDTQEVLYREGYRVIQKMVYDRVRKYIDEEMDRLVTQGIKIFGVKIDSLLISKDDADKLDIPESYPELSVFDSMGKPRKEKPKRVDLKLIESRTVEPVPTTSRRAQNTYILQNEFATDEAFEILRQTTEVIMDNDDGEKICMPKNFIIEGIVAGAGKTQLATSFAEHKSNNYIVATFSNPQAMKFMEDNIPAMTLYSLCGTSPGREDDVKVKHVYDTVVVDELGMESARARMMLLKYMEMCPQTQFIATEDLYQLPPIENDWNPFWTKEWYAITSRKMFQNKIYLQIPKRYGPEDTQKVINLKNDLFETDSFNINKYAKNVVNFEDLWTPDSVFITHSNPKRHQINSIIHKHRGFTDYYVKGERYICKNQIQHDKRTICNGFIYTLIDFTDSDITWQGPVRGESKDGKIQYITEKITIKRYDNRRTNRLTPDYFSLPYCRTCSSIQGSTVKGNVVVFESDGYYADNNWKYVALTRASDLSKVYYVDGFADSMDEKDIQRKLDNYYSDDRKKKRQVDSRYKPRDVKEMSKKQGHLCGRCFDVMNFVCKSIHGKTDMNDWSLDRLDESRGHEKGNCFLSHVGCNVGKVGDE